MTAVFKQAATLATVLREKASHMLLSDGRYVMAFCFNPFALDHSLCRFSDVANAGGSGYGNDCASLASTPNDVVTVIATQPLIGRNLAKIMPANGRYFCPRAYNLRPAVLNDCDLNGLLTT